MERMVGDGRLDGGAQESLLNPFLLSNCRGHFFKKTGKKRQAGNCVSGILGWSSLEYGVCVEPKPNPLWRRLSLLAVSSFPSGC